MNDVTRLGFIPRKWQIPIFLGLLRFSILVIHRGAGKTVLAILKLIDEALECDHEHGLYGYIAPELKQAKGVAWTLLKSYALKVPGTNHNESELWVEFENGARIQLFGADYYDSLRGRHFSGVVIDEVAQMKREVWVLVILPALGNRGGWAIFIGTPNGINLFSEIYYGAIASPEWFHQKLTAYDTGVFTLEELEKMKKDPPIGMGERAFRQEMMCDFMATSDNVLISLDEAQAAATRVIPHDQYSFAPKILGVDVAWQGGDRSVIFPRQGLVAFKPSVYPGLPEKAFASRIAGVWDKWKPDACFVDTTGGYGGEVVSRLRDMGYNPQEVVFSWGASNPRFKNIRAEMWFKMADWVKTGSIPNDSGLMSELCAPTYSNDNAANVLILESKDAVKDRLGVSPDLADSLAISFAFPVATKSELGILAAKRAQCDYDPFEEGR